MAAAVLILSVILSAVAAGVVSCRLNAGREQFDRRAQKAERLFCAVDALDRDLSTFFNQRYALAGQVRPGQRSEPLDRADMLLSTIKMLVGFYFPALSPVLARVSAAAETAQHSLALWEELREEDRGQMVEMLDDAVAELKRSLEALKSAILTQAVTFGTAPPKFIRSARSAIGSASARF